MSFDFRNHILGATEVSWMQMPLVQVYTHMYIL